MRRLVAATSLAVVGALAPAVVLAPASAQTVRMHDRVGDDKTGRGFGDVKWIRVRYDANRLRITVKSPRSGDVEHYQDLYVDVRKADQKPDLVIGSNGDAEAWSVGFVRNWRMDGWRQRCSSKFHSVDYDYRHHVMRYSIPRTCLMRPGAEQPKRIRVSLATRTEWNATYDWVPDKKTFGRWVHWK